MFAVEPKDGKVFTQKTLAIIEEITQASWQMPYSIRVDSITNFGAHDQTLYFLT